MLTIGPGIVEAGLNKTQSGGTGGGQPWQANNRTVGGGLWRWWQGDSLDG